MKKYKDTENAPKSHIRWKRSDRVWKYFKNTYNTPCAYQQLEKTYKEQGLEAPTVISLYCSCPRCNVVM